MLARAAVGFAVLERKGEIAFVADDTFDLAQAALLEPFAISLLACRRIRVQLRSAGTARRFAQEVSGARVARVLHLQRVAY